MKFSIRPNSFFKNSYLPKQQIIVKASSFTKNRPGHNMEITFSVTDAILAIYRKDIIVKTHYYHITVKTFSVT